MNIFLVRVNDSQGAAGFGQDICQFDPKSRIFLLETFDQLVFVATSLTESQIWVLRGVENICEFPPELEEFVFKSRSPAK